MYKWLFILLQRCLPQHLLSRLLGQIANKDLGIITILFIKWYIKYYHVNMQEAKHERPCDYKTFNDFFTRSLKINARVINCNSRIIISPVDGIISQIGTIDNTQIIQAKGISYTLQALLGNRSNDDLSFENGKFLTFYLSPQHYHRVHMPITATLQHMSYIAGKLFSVNPVTTANLSHLFTRNERMISIFDSTIGRVAIIMVGAMLVASIHTVWAGKLKAKHLIYQRKYDNITLKQGDEMGHFQLGSTVILLFSKNSIDWHTTTLTIGKSVKCGQPIATIMTA